MAGLLSLSNELLLQVFLSCATIQQVVGLFQADDTLRSIWLRYRNPNHHERAQTPDTRLRGRRRPRHARGDLDQQKHPTRFHSRVVKKYHQDPRRLLRHVREVDSLEEVLGVV
jgi:hypothetical protein